MPGDPSTHQFCLDSSFLQTKEKDKDYSEAGKAITLQGQFDPLETCGLSYHENAHGYPLPWSVENYFPSTSIG